MSKHRRYDISHDASRVPHVYIVSSGLGHIQRGFENHARDCYKALKDDPGLRLTLFGGGSSLPVEARRVPTALLRGTRAAKTLGYLVHRDPYERSYLAEQASFALGLLPWIYRERPDVIYFSDGRIGTVLWHWRRWVSDPGYKLLFCNGAPEPPGFDRWDYVQQVNPLYFRMAEEVGIPRDKQGLIPHAMCIPSRLRTLTLEEHWVLRRALELPERRRVLLSVAAINRAHKRVDYVIREVSRMPKPRPFLLLLGQQEPEASELHALATKLLGPEGFAIRTVPHARMADYYASADVFVLASLHEGFGMAFVEALSYGLPCLAHDYEVARYVLGEQGYLADLRQSGALASLASRVLASGEADDPSLREARHRSVLERFSWESLRPDYVAMMRHCAEARD